MELNISQEIIEDLFEVLKSIVGKMAVDTIRRRVEEKGLNSPVDIAFEVAADLERVFGTKGAFATLREVGRHVAKDLMEKHPKEEWEEVFEKALNVMGYAKGIKKEGDLACICSCVFYPRFLERGGFKPVEHPVCWMGLGFVEGFMKAFTGAHGVRFKGRDYEKEQCWFELVRF